MPQEVAFPADAAAEVPTTAPLLELRGLHKRWPRQPKPVLDGLDLDVYPGTVTWISGRNGIGKTTMLRIAAGLIRADAGGVGLDGLDPILDRRAYQLRVGFLSAGFGGLYARLTVRRHLDLWSRLAFIPRRRRREVIEQSLERFDLHELADRRVDRMSMGQRQRARLASAFLHDPDVVLLDEPRNSLDDTGIARLDAAIKVVVGRGGAVVWCAPTGDPQDVATDERYELADGRLLEA